MRPAFLLALLAVVATAIPGLSAPIDSASDKIPSPQLPKDGQSQPESLIGPALAAWCKLQGYDSIVQCMEAGGVNGGTPRRCQECE
ncbi:hypothetical protein BCR44DRAFT_47792 [Catenaria anguillulae PL171]|uniref:Uncharacterized protein n=1 Tax=Catenaria anguillulae PL171 TaxID=765915 RepID=A0A1Y2I2V5_9FUNG|nr:hypothetical protein BCR44DRAFT_47792 [Catenaria anguillulae PL171]